MITFTREEADRLLDTLAETIDAQQWEIDNHIKTYGEWYRPKRVEYMKNALNNTLRMIEVLSHKLNEPPKNQVRPHEFLKAVEGKESFVGVPILWAEWPTLEPTIDGWPLYSGLPDWASVEGTKREYGEGMVEKKVAITQDETISIVCHESVAQYAQVNGIVQQEPVAYIDVETRNLSWAKPTRWETPTVVKMDKVPLYTTPPSAPIPKMREMLEVQGSDGNWNYDSYMHGMYNGMEYIIAMVESREPVFREAPKKWLSKREWVELTEDEIEDLTSVMFEEPSDEEVIDFALRVQAKLKEKNT